MVDANGPARRLFERQRLAAERLRRELMGLDGSQEHPYFLAFNRQLARYAKSAADGDLDAAAARAELVYVGDFHAVPRCQTFAADLLERISAVTPHLALGVEFLYTRQQRLLDRRQAGLLDDGRFLKRVHYREEWGYPWAGYRDLLDRARRLDVPVFALDAPPRGGFDGLQRRDQHAARRIATILAARPEMRLLVLFGETHLAAGHLPRRARTQLRRAGVSKQELVVFQNPDPVYWTRVAEGRTPDRPLQLDGGVFAAFNASPLEKYESYRQVVERWRDDVPHDEEIDLTPAVHHLVGVLCRWIGIRPEQRRVSHRAGWSEELIDAYPEVYGGTEAAELLEPVMRENGRTTAEIDESRKRLSQRGALYESRSNALFLARYLPGPAAGEGARFLRAALTGRLFIALEDFTDDPAESAYGAAYNEALAYLGSRLVDPTSSFVGTEGPALLAAAGSTGAGPVNTGDEAQWWIDLHERFERVGGSRPPHELLDRLRASRPLRRRLARELGARLGRALFERVRGGDLDRRGLRRLFTRPLQPRQAAGHVLQLLRQ